MNGKRVFLFLNKVEFNFKVMKGVQLKGGSIIAKYDFLNVIS